MPKVRYNGKTVHFDYTPSGISMAKKTAKKYNTEVIWSKGGKAENGLTVPNYTSGGGVTFYEKKGPESKTAAAPLPVGEGYDLGKNKTKNKTKNKNKEKNKQKNEEVGKTAEEEVSQEVEETGGEPKPEEVPTETIPGEPEPDPITGEEPPPPNTNPGAIDPDNKPPQPEPFSDDTPMARAGGDEYIPQSTFGEGENPNAGRGEGDYSHESRDAVPQTQQTGGGQTPQSQQTGGGQTPQSQAGGQDYIPQSQQAGMNNPNAGRAEGNYSHETPGTPQTQIGGVGDKLGDATEGVGDKLGDATEGMGDKLGDATEGLGDKLGDATEGLGDKLGDATEGLGDKLGDVADEVTGRRGMIVKRKKKYQDGGEVDPPKRETAYDDLKSKDELKNKPFSNRQSVDLTSVQGQDARKRVNEQGGGGYSEVKTDKETGERYRQKDSDQGYIYKHDKEDEKERAQHEKRTSSSPSLYSDKKDPYSGTVNPNTGKTYTEQEATEANKQRQTRGEMAKYDQVDRKKTAPLVQSETGGMESDYNTYTGRPTSLSEEGSRSLAQRKYRPEYEGANKYSDKLDFTGDSKVNLNKTNEGGKGHYDSKRKAVFNPNTGVWDEKVKRKSGFGYRKTGRQDSRGAEDYLANKQQEQSQNKQEKQRKKDLKKTRKENDRKRKDQAKADKKNPKLMYDGSNWVKNPNYKAPQEGERKFMGGGKIKKRKYL